MGIFSKLFGKGNTRCGECGRGFEMPSQLLNLYSLDINNFSIEGMGGYCSLCQKYLCDRHLQFVKLSLDPNDIGFTVGCKRCGVPVTLEPVAVAPDIEQMRYIKIIGR